MAFELSTRIHSIVHPLLKANRIVVDLKRDDEIHPEVSGNKWRKLKFNIEAARQKGKDTILTFGGAYSNHIAATAAATKILGLKSIGIIRGEELADQSLNPTLARARQNGMTLRFVSRQEYREKEAPFYKHYLKDEFGAFHQVPEGGANYHGMIGCQEIWNEVKATYSHVVLPTGTGTTLAGLATVISDETLLIGVPVLKGYPNTEGLEKLLYYFYVDDVTAQRAAARIQLWSDYHFGGYAAFSESLISFIREFKNQTGVRLDPIYTGKMAFALFDQIQNGKIPPNSRVLMIHTGGLQGIEGFEQRHQIHLFD